MTPEEAIRQIQIHSTVLQMYEDSISSTTEALDMAIRALERRLPTKPIKPFEQTILKCPYCGKHIDKKYIEYCYECGQRLDWRNEDER